MRWLNEPPPRPNAGQARIRRVFAWRPTRVNQFTVWLESYEVYEVFFSPINGNEGWWSESNRTVLNLTY